MFRPPLAASKALLNERTGVEVPIPNVLGGMKRLRAYDKNFKCQLYLLATDLTIQCRNNKPN